MFSPSQRMQRWPIAHARFKTGAELFSARSGIRSASGGGAGGREINDDWPREICYAGRTLSIKDGFSQIELLGLTTERWAEYRRQLRGLGLVLVTKGDGGVEFRVDRGSFSNGDSYKGYEYDAKPAEHLKASLDGYRISESDRDASGGITCPSYSRGIGVCTSTSMVNGHWAETNEIEFFFSALISAPLRLCVEKVYLPGTPIQVRDPKSV